MVAIQRKKASPNTKLQVMQKQFAAECKPMGGQELLDHFVSVTQHLAALKNFTDMQGVGFRLSESREVYQMKHKHLYKLLSKKMKRR